MDERVKILERYVKNFAESYRNYSRTPLEMHKTDTEVKNLIELGVNSEKDREYLFELYEKEKRIDLKSD